MPSAVFKFSTLLSMLIFTGAVCEPQAHADTTSNTTVSSQAKLVSHNLSEQLEQCRTMHYEDCITVLENYRKGLIDWEPDFATVLAKSSELCSTRNSSACLITGLFYHFGASVEPDLAKAGEYYRLSCDYNLPRGCGLLGYTLLVHSDNSPGGNKGSDGYKLAKEAFEKGCSMADANSCYGLAKIYTEGLGVATDAKQALTFALKACELGLAGSCHAAGAIHYDAYLKDGGEDHLKANFELQSKACKLGDVNGCYMLSSAYLRGEGTAKNYQQVESLLPSQCESGHALSCGLLGSYYAGLDQNNQFRDPALAEQYLIMGCNFKDYSSCALLGSLYALGDKLPKDVEMASALAALSCSNGSSEGCNLAESLHLELYPLEQDGDGSKLAYLEQSCNDGHSEDCNLLATAYTQGLALGKDLAKSVKLYEKSCALNDGKGCFLAGVLSENVPDLQKVQLAENFYQKSCQLDFAEGCAAIALKEIQADVSSTDNLVKACRLNNGYSCALLSLMYQEGSGVEANEIQALSYAQKACSLNEKIGCEVIVSFQESNSGKISLGKKQIMVAAQKGCLLQDAPSCLRLSKLYLAGDGLPKDYELSELFYRKACSLDPQMKCEN